MSREWEDIPQHVSVPARAARTDVRLFLGVYGRHGTRSSLTVTVPPPVREALGWDAGTTLGLALGSGRAQGWLRLSQLPGGRVLRRVGRRESLIVTVIPPAAWWHLAAPSTVCQHRIQGDALLIEIPWDMDEIAAAEPAAEEAA